MLIGTGDLEMVRNAGTPCRECLKTDPQRSGAPKRTILEFSSAISCQFCHRLSSPVRGSLPNRWTVLCSYDSDGTLSAS
jgi:hypothetical protein